MRLAYPYPDSRGKHRRGALEVRFVGEALA